MSAGTRVNTGESVRKSRKTGFNCRTPVVSGLVRLFIPLPNHMERVVALVHQGDGLGESCLVLNESCPFHAVACKDSHLLAIDGMVYRKELERNSILASKTLERISKRLMETLRDTEICAQRSSVQRVACFLMRHQPATNVAAFKFQLPARKQDIAAKLGLTQETLSRVLSFLDKQGLIQMKGAQISIEDGGKLAEITSMRDPKDSDFMRIDRDQEGVAAPALACKSRNAT